MKTVIDVTVLDFVAAPGAMRSQGLLGWARLRLPGVLLDAVAVRRTRDGELRLSFPKRDGRALVRPEDDVARREIEAAVIGELRRRGDVQ